MTAQPIIVWFRRDLRLYDHGALSAAVGMGAPLVPVYIHDDETPGRPVPGAASRWWLHESLQSLDSDLRRRGSRLVLARGPALNVLADLARETGASAIYWSRGYEPRAVKLEGALQRALEGAGVRCRRFSGSLLFEPEDVRSDGRAPHHLFSRFQKSCMKLAAPGKVLKAPPSMPRVPEGVESDTLELWNLQSSEQDRGPSISAAWTPGETGARARLEGLICDRLEDYARARAFPGVEGTSRLSPHLHFGEISPREVWNAVSLAVSAAAAKGRNLEAGARSFLAALVWREFPQHLLFHWPHLASSPFDTEFADFPWRGGDADLKAWQEGRTGIPIIDAGMRELWTTGWMHHEVRVIAASFLVKHLLISWQSGADWFRDTLVDADPASNAVNWQRVAGCGADAAAHGRVINPVLRGRKLDPGGAYVKSWVPELAKLPAKHIHAPWRASEKLLAGARVRLGETYPEPIVDLAAARARALGAYETIKGGSQ